MSITLTFLHLFLLEDSPAHLLEVVQVKCEPLVRLLPQASQLPEPNPIILVPGTLEIYAIE